MKTAGLEVDLPASTQSPQVNLKLSGVSKTYETSKQNVEAIQNINLEINKSEIVVFFGPSGCGKSTLLNMIAGLETPTEGEITLDGVPVVGPHHDRLLIFQEHGLYPWLNVIENVMFGLKRTFNFQPTQRREVARQFLKMVNLEEFEQAAIHELSGGMRRRATLARALAVNPKLLLMDEAFNALDALTRTKLYGDLQAIFKQTQKTIILVTHNPREAVCLGDRVLVFSGRPGQIKAEIPINLPRPRDINNPKVSEYAITIMNELEASSHANGK